jgi:ribosomal protein S18 acetylase RimI-like enzyme
MARPAASTTLRPACPADADFLLAVYASTRAEELAQVPWEPAQRETFLQMQFEAQRRAYAQAFPALQSQIIMCDGHDIGRLLLAELADEFRVVDLALLPDYRRQGIGTALLAEIMAQAGRAGKAVRLHVEIWNPAQRLYDRLGFRPAGEQGLYRLLEWQPARQPGPAAGQPGAAAPNRAWPHGAYVAQLNTGFRLHLAGAGVASGGALDLELVEVSPLRVTPQQEIFALVLRGPVDRLLPQQIYALEHATLGACDLFLVPIRQDPAGIYYEAVFNRLVGPA